MKRFYLQSMLVPLLLAASATAWAVPANRTPRRLSLPDGTTLTLTLAGDEHHHAYFTTDGYAVLPANDGYYYYATLDAQGRAVRSDVRAHDEDLRSAAEMAFADSRPHDAIARALDAERAERVAHRQAAGYVRTTPRQAALSAEQAADGPQRKRQLDSTYPTTGQQKGLVILVQYTDVKFKADSATTYAYFHGMLNEEGFSEHRAHGSARDYFLASSMGQFSPTFDVYGPITLSHNQAYYGGNDWYGNDQRPEQMVIEACQQLDATVDFSEYDRDHDGEIDNVYVFYAGLGEANGGSANTVWPHSWDVRSAGSYIYLDGCALGHYACSNEIEPSYTTGQQEYDGIGTFTHEFSHVLGLPDLYATSYTSAFTPGDWDILDAGPYNGDGRRPPYYNAYERYEMGWMTPTPITDHPNTYTLRPIYNNEAYIIPTEKSNEYFLLENRQQVDWDTEIPGHGMLIWHIDYNASVWSQNTVNNTASHQYVDIEEADNTRTEYTRAGDAFPGTSNVTSFTDNTTPNMKSWSGKGQGRPITNIREQNGLITFDVLGGRPQLPAVPLDSITDIRPDGFTLHWTPVDATSAYIVTIYTVLTLDGGRQVTVYAEGYRNLEIGDVDSLVVNGLTPATDYFVSFAAYDGLFTGEATTASARTADPTFEFFAPTLLEATDIWANSFTALWEPLDEATGYEISIYDKTLGAPDKSIEQHFDNKLTELGSMWHTNVTVTYMQAAYAGENPPSIRFLTDGDYVETSQLDGDIQRAQFWHRTTSDPGENTVLVQVRVGGTWQTIDSVAPHNVDGGELAAYGLGEECPIPAGARSLRLLYDRKNAARVAIDDIIIDYGGSLVVDSIPELTEVSVDATEFTAQHLEAMHTYYYKVRARKGDLYSLWSQEGIVTTSDVVNGIEEVIAAGRPDAAAAPVYDLQGRRLLAAPRRGAYISNGRLLFAK